MVLEKSGTVVTKRPVRRRRWLAVAKVLAAIVLLFVVSLGRFLLPPPALKFSLETTYLVDPPRNPDGTPDYVAALNAHWLEGATPENNAVVPFLRIVGPEVIEKPIRERYFELLGVEVPAIPENRFVMLQEYLNDHGVNEERSKELQEIAFGPLLKNASQPELIAWVAINSPMLDRLAPVGRMERFSTPILTLLEEVNEVPLFTTPANEYDQMKWIAIGFYLRSQVRLADGDHEGAIEDAASLLRWGRLLANDQFAICNLVGMAIYLRGIMACEILVLSEKLSVNQVLGLKTQVQLLTPQVSQARVFGFAERVNHLQTLQSFHLTRTPPIGGSRMEGFLYTRLDLNAALPPINSLYDQVEDALATSSFSERSRKLDALEVAMEKSRFKYSNPARRLGQSTIASRTQLSKEFGEYFAWQIMPDFFGLQHAAERVQQRYELLITAASVAEYRAKNRKLPNSLSDLVPDQLQRIPVDVYTGAEIRYVPSNATFLLYSFGINGVDNGGLEGERELGRMRSELGIEHDDVTFGPPVPVSRASSPETLDPGVLRPHR